MAQAAPPPALGAATVPESIRSAARRCGEAPALLWFGRCGGDEASAATEPGGAEGGRPGESWTYAAVWAAAASAARRLRGIVGGDGARVGIAVDEGTALPLLELAVLLAGGAVVPLDPRDPPARLAVLIERAALVVAVAADASVAETVESAAAVAARPLTLVLASDVVDPLPPPAAGGDGSVDEELPLPDPDAISHVFFTSGSTGLPKGCVVKHRALASYCAARNEAYGFGRGDVTLVASAHTFDPSLGDLMATWVAGGCAAYAPRAATFSRLGALLAASSATHLCCTPSLFVTLSGTAAAAPGALPSLRVVALGGEPTPPALLQKWAGRRPEEGPALWNTYGVTECCVYNAARRRRPGDAPALIDPPLPGNGLLVVADMATDEGARGGAGCPAEACVGEVGELVVFGAQVGEGYAAQPDLTSQHFVLHARLGRCYLSGDLAMRVAGEGGDLEGISLLGRRDHQVKVRGFRIELAEAEHWLLLAAGRLLSAAAAVCAAGQLVLLCAPAPELREVASRGGPRGAEVLRDTLRWLASRDVPAQMRPQRYFFVEALPATSSGKIDRGVLRDMLPPPLGSGGAALLGAALPDEDGAGSCQALSAMEAFVAETWASEFAQPAGGFSRSADFQELGGHSIGALRVCRRLALAFGGAACGGAVSADDHEAVLGGDLGELSGPFAPCELLQRPRLADYAAFLEQEGLAAPTSAPERVAGNAEAPAPAQQEGEDAGYLDDGDGPAALDVAAASSSSDAGAVALLHRAAAAGAVAIVEMLVDCGFAPVDGHCSMRRLKAATRAQRALWRVGKDGLRPTAPLHSAASAGSASAVRSLLRLRATITATDGHGVMALHLAASGGPAEVVDLLLDARAPLAAKDLNQQTVLHFAARSGRADTMALLLQRWCADADVTSQGSRVYGGPLDWRDRWHRTPVHWAVLNGHAEALRALLAARAAPVPPKVPTSKHAKHTTLRLETPLEIAQRRGHAEAERLLLDAAGLAPP